jgi:hypothetical protein
MDPDQFTKFASGTQNIVTSLGIIIGGLWVMFTFWHLRAAQKSRAEIAEIEQRSVEQPVLAIDIKWEPLGEAGNGKCFISLRAIVRNDGKRALYFSYTGLQISKLSEKSGEPEPDVPILRLKPQILDNEDKLSESLIPLRPAAQNVVAARAGS